MFHYRYVQLSTGQSDISKYKGSETGIVESVKVVGNDMGNEISQRAYIQLRIQVSKCQVAEAS